MIMTKEPIHVISLGAGVQSSTMALMAACGEITPMPVAAIFADTQDEPGSVYSWLDWLEKQLPFPVWRVTRGSLSKATLRIGKRPDGSRWVQNLIPTWVMHNGQSKPFNRSCTRDYKVIPIRRRIKAELEATGISRCIQWLGISVDEVVRMKESQDRVIDNRWPLIEKRMARTDCLQWMKRHGFPQPPRSACIYCPFHSDAEWRKIKASPDWDGVVSLERALQEAYKQHQTAKCIPYFHKSCQPIDKVDLSTEEERGQLNMFNNECEGMCGV